MVNKAVFVQKGRHLTRTGVGGLGGELQRKAISRQLDWGAKGIVSASITFASNCNSDKQSL